MLRVPPKASLRNRGQWKWIAEVCEGKLGRQGMAKPLVFSRKDLFNCRDSPVFCNLSAPHQPMVKLGTETFQAGAGRGDMSQNNKNSTLEEANFRVEMDLLK